MKKNILKTISLSLLCSTVVIATSCKKKEVVETQTNTEVIDTATTTETPVEISTDEALVTNVKDATKDYPAVVASVQDGVVTLTGTISRDKLPQLMQNLNALNPKKIDNNLTISN